MLPLLRESIADVTRSSLELINEDQVNGFIISRLVNKTYRLWQTVFTISSKRHSAQNKYSNDVVNENDCL